MSGSGQIQGHHAISGTSLKDTIGRAGLFVLLFSLFGFKPAPKPGLPKFTISDSVAFQLISFSGRALIEKGVARVSVAFMFAVEDTSSTLYPISLYLRADSVQLFINGDKYEYVPSQMDIIMVPRGYNYLQMNYIIPTAHTFSGPPSSWVYGEAFELSVPFVHPSWGAEKIIPQQFVFVVVAPNNYQYNIAKDGWILDKSDEKTIFFTTDPHIFNASNYWYIMYNK